MPVIEDRRFQFFVKGFFKVFKENLQRSNEPVVTTLKQEREKTNACYSRRKNFNNGRAAAG